MKAPKKKKNVLLYGSCFLLFFLIQKMNISLLLFALLPITVFGLFGSGGGIILYGSDQNTRSGVLGANHKCTEFPKSFKAAHVQNSGSSHCAMWTQPDCKGKLYVVPAHYKITMPSEQFESVIC